MKRKLTIAALAALAAAALAAVAFGSDAGGSARAIAAIAKGTGITFVDADHSGKPRRRLRARYTTYVSPATGKAIGRGSVVCAYAGARGVLRGTWLDAKFSPGQGRLLTRALIDRR
jgi:hypothetical protein